MKACSAASLRTTSAYQRRSAPSAANPGPSPIIRPQAPGIVVSLFRASSSTKKIVADAILPYRRRIVRE